MLAQSPIENVVRMKVENRSSGSSVYLDLTLTSVSQYRELRDMRVVPEHLLPVFVPLSWKALPLKALGDIS